MMPRIAAFVAAVLFGMLVIGPIGAAGHSSETAAGPVTAIRVSGTFIDAEGVGTFSGTLDIQRFAAIDHRVLVAVGTVSGTLTSALGTTHSVTDQPVALPVTKVSVSGRSVGASSAPVTTQPVTTQQAAQDCQILHLEFGGITLNVLGIAVQLSPIVLDVDLGGILGGILCGLLGALGGGAPAQAQANMLNNALGVAR